MKHVLLFTLILFFAMSLKAQDIAGKWEGTLRIQGAELPLVFKITKNNDIYTTVMDSPAQGSRDIPIEETRFINNRLSLSSPKLGIKFAGAFMPDSNKINGIFNQAKFSLPLKLLRSTMKDDIYYFKPPVKF